MQQTPPSKPAPPAPKPKPPEPPAEFRAGNIAKMDASELIGILKDPASSEFKKAKACMRIGELGAKEAVPALAALLPDEHMSVYARYGLEPISDASADEALRGALSNLKGNLLVGVVNSIGKRRDLKASPILVKMMLGENVDLARAAASALGSIGGVSNANELKAGFRKADEAVKPAIADASLICAERLLSEGKRAEALDLYAFLSAPEIPKPMRLAAMSGIIREETSVSRPR